MAFPPQYKPGGVNPLSGVAQSTTPGPYPGMNTFQQRPPSPGFNPSVAAGQQANQNMLGPFASLLPPGQPLLRADVPLLETGLNFEQQQRAERDRQLGYEELSRGRAAIGSSPSATLAREIAMERAQGDGPGGVIRSSGAVAMDDIARAIQQDYASRNIGGGVPAIAQAQVQQDLMAQIAERAALADEQFQQDSLAELLRITEREEAERAAYDRALAAVFLDTERQPYDLSALLTRPRHGDELVGLYS